MLPIQLLRVVTRWPYSLRLGVVVAHGFGSPLILYCNSHRKLGWDRVSPVALVVILNSVLPSFFDPINEVVSLSTFGLQFMWLSSFKVLGWAIGRGPLADPRLNRIQFIAVTSLPITPLFPTADPQKSHLGTASRSWNARHKKPGPVFRAAVVDVVSKSLCLCCTTVLLQRWRALPRLVWEFTAGVGLYLSISLAMSTLGLVSTGLLGLHIAPHFNRPYLSSSLAEFWSRRWNLNTGHTMRFTVYDAILSGHLVKTPGEAEGAHLRQKASFWRLAAAVCASFVCSGVMHEAFVVHLRGRFSGYWMAFFSCQGPLIVAESLLRSQLRRRKRAMPNLIAVPATLLLLLLLADWLFFPEILKMNAEENKYM